MNQTIFTELRTILAELYADEASMRRITADAGIDSSRVTFGISAQNCWHSILTEAHKTHQLDALLTIVAHEYGSNQKFRATYELYRRAVDHASVTAEETHHARIHHQPQALLPKTTIESDTLNALVRLLTPLMADENRRRALLQLAVGSSPLFHQIHFSGPATTFTVQMVHTLAQFGEIAPGRAALGALLQVCREEVGVDQQAVFDQFSTKLQTTDHQPPKLDHDGADARQAVSALPPLTKISSEQADFSPYYQRSWAVVIGIDAYSGRHARLANAGNDARAMATLLRNYGFDPVVTFYDTGATRAAMMTYLDNELTKQAGPDDRVVLFFAGHGTTQTDLDGRQHGYLVPYDSHRVDEYIEMEEVRQLCRRLRAKHILLLLACCFSGVAAMASATPVASSIAQDNLPKDDEFLRTITRRRAWQVLTAGAADEMVADSSIQTGRSAFTAALVAGLEGAADHNRDGLITATDLAAYVRLQMGRENRLRGLTQTPFFACLSGEESGDVVFETRGRAVSDPHLDYPAIPAKEAWRAPQLLIGLLLLGAIISFLLSLVSFIFANVPLHTNPLDPNSATTTPEMALITAVVLLVVAVALSGIAYALHRDLIGQRSWQAETVRQYKRELQPLLTGLRSARVDEQQRRYAQWLTQQSWNRLTDKRHKAELILYLYQQQLIVNPAVISLRELDLAGLDLTKRNLRAIDLAGANLQKTNFRHATLIEANLRSANLTEADLWSANLRDAALDEAILDRANLTAATLTARQLLTVKSQRQTIGIDGSLVT